MRHRLSGLPTYGLNGLDREMSTPPTLLEGHGPPLPYLLPCYLRGRRRCWIPGRCVSESFDVMIKVLPASAADDRRAEDMMFIS